LWNAGLSYSFSLDDFDKKSADSFREDCEEFLSKYGHMINDPHQAGHDFLLARNGTGCGFIDRRDDIYTLEVRHNLQKAAQSYSEIYLYIENGKVHF
jgi:hypothetical protein